MKPLYITKYALTHGIYTTSDYHFQTSPLFEKPEDFVFAGKVSRVFKIGRDAFFDLEEAFAAAEELRKKKIRLYEKRVKALKSKPIKFAEKELE